MNGIEAYAIAVQGGHVPAGKYHRLACVRHLNDLARQDDPEFPWRFDLAQAVKFFEFALLLKHYKGQWVGQNVYLTEFQQFRLGCIFGWRSKANGFRRFTTAYNELPRKQGKSFEAAIVGVYTTFFEGEAGAEGYCIATKEKQAMDVVFHDIKQLIRSSGLSSLLNVRVKNIHDERTVSKLEPLGADSDTLDGLNPHCILTDELHAFKTRGLLDVMESATGARRNPLHYQITTAGDDPVSVCGDQHAYACQVLEGVLDDLAAQTFFACIAHADEEDDWTSEVTWKKANPHYGISVQPDDMRKLCEKAQAMPSAAAEFKQKRLNLWVNASAPCLSVEGWRKGQSDWTLKDMEHEPCFIAVDLASKIDLCSLSALFPPAPGRPKWRLYQRLWTPEETLAERAHRDRAPYQVWVDQGWLTAVPGTSLDHDVIREAILELREIVDIQQIGFDPWHAETPIKQLVKLDGFAETQVIAVPQTFAGMSAACLRMQAEILSSSVDARGCPVTSWAVSNVVDQRDGKDNIMFIKKKSRGRIDPVISATIAMSLAIRHEAAQVVIEYAEWI